MKKKAILCFAALAAICAVAEEAAIGGLVWTYSLESGCATITGGRVPSRSDLAGDVSLPEMIAGGNSVVAVGNEALAGNAAIVGIEIPYSVTNVGARAFAGCTALSFVAILNPSCVVAADSFEGCSAITTAVLPSSLEDDAATIFPAASAVEVYRADRIDAAAPKAAISAAALTGIKPTSTPGVCKITFDARLANGVDANIDPANIRIIRAASIRDIKTMTAADATSDPISGDISARDKLEMTFRVTVDTSADADIPVSYGEDEKPESESPDKRHFKIITEN